MGVTRGRLLQRAGSLGLNGGGAAAAVPLHREANTLTDIHKKHITPYNKAVWNNPL